MLKELKAVLTPVRIALIKNYAIKYLIVTGLAAHIVLVSLYFGTDWVTLAKDKFIHKLKLDVLADYFETPQAPLDIHAEIASNFGTWEPHATTGIRPQKIMIGDKEYANLDDAVKALKPGETLELGAGVYKTPLVIRQNQVTIAGRGHVIFDGPSAEGKATFVVKGKDTRIFNIECRNIRVPSGNGACVRQEGENLTLEHVYFHDSEEGVLTTATPGLVTVKDSRFELLGKEGRAHGIYTGGGELDIEDSLFIAAVDEGHEIKSRSSVTKINRTVVASLSSKDSRLIDISNGGLVTIKDCILEKGPGSVNSTAIGYGLEGMTFSNNYLILKNNLVLLEKIGPNHLVQIKEGAIAPVLVRNIIVTTEKDDFGDANLKFKSRKKAGLDKYPYLPGIETAIEFVSRKFQ